MTSTIAARQVQPAAVAAPTARGVISPTPAAAALPVLSSDGPYTPLCACSTVVEVFTATPPPNPTTIIAGRVTASSAPDSSEPAVNSNTATVNAAMPRWATPYRRQRRARLTPV